MQRGMVDLLTAVAARRGAAGADLAAWISKKSDEIGFHPSPFAAAEAALARGEFAHAVEVADQLAQGARMLGQQRGCLIAVEWGLQARAELQRWKEILERADAAIREAEEKKFRTRLWRMLAWRARARHATGDPQGASDDRTAAGRLLEEMVASIADPDNRTAFEADPLAVAVRDR
jgi:hypothetical protein